MKDNRIDGLSEDEIAASIGVTRARVSQILNSAYRKLRKNQRARELANG